MGLAQLELIVALVLAIPAVEPLLQQRQREEGCHLQRLQVLLVEALVLVKRQSYLEFYLF